jgi:hypothetical protein
MKVMEKSSEIAGIGEEARLVNTDESYVERAGRTTGGLLQVI